MNTDVSGAPYTYDFGLGGTLTFDENATGFASAIGVATTGSTQVFSVFGSPSLFQPFATTLFPSQQLGSFASYASSTAVAYSQSAGSIGFKFTLADGDHFGIAKTEGSTIANLFFESTPGADVSLAAAVPEPATWAMMILGFAAIGLIQRRVRSNASVVS